MYSDQTLIQGGIMRRQRGCCVEALRDIFYTLTGLILSLVPAWRPYAIFVPPTVQPQPQQEHEHQD